MKYLLTYTLFIFSFVAWAQLPYTQSQYSWQLAETDVEYGVAIGFAGNSDTLLLDIYKPVGDNNCERPLMILVHGGSWIAGSKNDGDIVAIAQKLAERGWVVAATNYRLGTHKAASYTMYWACSNTVSAPCAYIADSSEVVRAIYRGMQDTKGAIRYMKSRHEQDSTDINNVFVAGTSAGAFIAMSTALMDRPEEKPADCDSIANAPTPDTDLVGCLPPGYTLTRPDLGDIEGDLHIGPYDASVKGVGDIFGGVLDLQIIQQAADTPAIYLFHQGSDVVVAYNHQRLLGRTSYECYGPTNLCQPYYFYPFAYGGESIRSHLNSMGTNAPLYQADIISNYSYGNNCFSNGHAIDNTEVRTQNMIDLFAQVIAASNNDPNSCATGISPAEELAFQLFPNPSNGTFSLHGENVEDVSIYSISGKPVYHQKISGPQDSYTISTQLKAGIYIFKISTDKKLFYRKLIIE